MINVRRQNNIYVTQQNCKVTPSDHGPCVLAAHWSMWLAHMTEVDARSEPCYANMLKPLMCFSFDQTLSHPQMSVTHMWTVFSTSPPPPPPHSPAFYQRRLLLKKQPLKNMASVRLKMMSLQKQVDNQETSSWMTSEAVLLLLYTVYIYVFYHILYMHYNNHSAEQLLLLLPVHYYYYD